LSFPGFNGYRSKRIPRCIIIGPFCSDFEIKVQGFLVSARIIICFPKKDLGPDLFRIFFQPHLAMPDKPGPIFVRSELVSFYGPGMGISEFIHDQYLLPNSYLTRIWTELSK
jgi:hypothetical protein